MSRIAYVNGAYRSIAGASVNIEDRGYQFADGVYEVCLVVNGRYWDEDGHLARLERSLAELSIAPPMARSALKVVMAKLLRANGLRDALVYMQVTRGVAARNHPFPDQIRPSFVMTARPFDFEKSEMVARGGVSVITAPDERWARVDIKSISLLPNVLAKQAAAAAGAEEAFLIKDGVVTEGASSNAWIVTEKNELRTHPLGQRVLPGITRAATLACAETLQLKIDETPFTQEDALAAKEVFLTSATNLVMPVTRINNEKISSGAPGEVTMRLRNAYIAACKGETAL